MITPLKFREWILQQKPLAHRVVVCYEAGPFGFTLARWLISEGIECLVMAPVHLDERHRRIDNDKLDSVQIGSRLDRYLAGNTRALSCCHIPTREEELKRTQTRTRQQLIDHRKAIQAQGRSLLWCHGFLGEEPRCWWKPRYWEAYQTELPSELKETLGNFRALLDLLEKQIAELEKQLAKQAQKEIPELMGACLPVGVGSLSMLILTREIMDWARFQNRRQIGCWTGLIPSEASTGQSRRQGSVTKVGNRCARMIAVEMAWRMVRYQPDCRAVRPWIKILKDRRKGAAARKRAIVAVARRLMIDLWRLATGQTTAERIGMRVKP